MLNILVFIFSTQSSKAQTTTFTYSSSGLSNSSSNVFSPAVTIGGHSHSAVLGGVTFSGGQLVLSTTPQASPAGGTAYAINFPFAQNTKYTISIVAQSGDGATLMAYVYGAIPSWANTSGTAPDGNISYLGTGTNIGTTFSPTSASATYSLSPFTPTSNNLNYLIIGASGGSDALSALSISSVTIVAVAATTPSQFTLSPTTLALNCGDVTARTFSVTNPQNIAGTVTYSWNVGAGWLYNGQVPTNPVTTAGSSIILTPVNTQQSVPQNISVGVYVNGSLYNTYACSLTQSNPVPALSISEVNAGAPVCSSTPQTFALTAPPSGSSVAWNLTPASGIGVLSPNGNQATVSYAGTGTASLTAAVTNTCGTWSYSYPSIIIGAPPTPTYISGIYNGKQFAPNSVYDFTSVGNVWLVGGGTILSGQGTTSIEVRTANPAAPTFAFDVSVANRNACGTSAYLWIDGTIVHGTGGGQVIISPNPAATTITISQATVSSPFKKSAETAAATPIQLVKIYDAAGRLRKTFDKGSAAGPKQLDISDLSNGIYFVEIAIGKDVERQKIVVMH